MLGNPDRIHVSIKNILENQLRYAASTIQVSLKESSDDWVIEISNDGPLIPEKDFNQFLRLSINLKFSIISATAWCYPSRNVVPQFRRLRL